MKSSRNPGESIEPERYYNDEDVIDLREYIAIISKWRGVIALLTICALVTSAIVSFFVLPPIYETKTVLMVAQSVSTSDRRTPTDQDNLESLVNTISSIPQLTMNTYVMQVKNDRLMGQVAQALKGKGVGEGLSARDLLGMVNAQALKDTNLIEITATNTDPQLAADIANTVQQEYLKFISTNNQEQMKNSVAFLQQQILLEEQNLDAANQQMQQMEGEPRNLAFLQKQIESKYADFGKYQALANQANFEYQQTLAGRNSLRQQLEAVSQTAASTSLNAATSATSAATDNSNGLVMPYSGLTDSASTGGPDAAANPLSSLLPGYSEVNTNPTYTSLKDALVRKEMDLAEKAAQFDAANGLVLSLEGDIRALQAEISEKKLAMDRLSATLAQSQNTYNLLNEKRIQTQIIQSVNVGESYLIPVSPAPVPSSPVKPNKQLNILIAGLLGLMVSAGLAFLLEFLDNTVKDAEDVQKIFDLPVVGNIPIFEETDAERKNRNSPKQPKHEHGEENFAWSKATT